MQESVCVRVPLRSAEEALRRLSSSGCLRSDLRVKRFGAELLIPLKESCDMIKALDGVPHNVCRDFFEERVIRKTFKDFLRDKLPKEVLKKIPSSIDLVGDIAVIKLPDEALPYANLVGEALVKVAKNVKAVYASGPVAGEFRVRELKHIYGLRKSKTVMREYGIKIVVDVLRAYVNPSLSEEHRRVALMVRDGEVVGDIFCGVGPFTLHILSVRGGVKVFAVDKNPEAIKCLIESLRLNEGRIKGSVTSVVGDAGVFSDAVRDEFFSRVIMNLPLRAHEYLPKYVRTLRVGGVMHVYAVASVGDEAISKVLSAVPKGYRMQAISVGRVIDYAPKRYVFRVDLKRVK